MTIRVLAIATAVVTAVAVAGAQQRPVFHSESNYVEVDAVVTDADGHFVPGLTAADFELREANRPQHIDLADVIDLGTTTRPAATPVRPARLRSDLGLPQDSLSGRVYLLYFRIASPQSMLEVGQHAQEFVKDFIEPGDLVGVWNDDSLSQSITFTTDRDQMLKELPPLGSAGGVASNPNSHLRDAVDWLSGIQGRRKALILFSPGWSTGRYPSDAGRVAGLVTPAWARPSDITGRADVHIYTVDSRGLVAPPLFVSQPGPVATRNGGSARAAATQLSSGLNAVTNGVEMMQSIAEETGGLAIFNTNDFRPGFARIVEDNTRYYVLGYLSSQKARDGRFVPISVTTTKPGVTIRARNGYIAR